MNSSTRTGRIAAGALILWMALLANTLAQVSGGWPGAGWVGSWAAAPAGWSSRGGPPSQANSTYRNVIHLSVGGDGLRVKLTNEFGGSPLRIGAAHVALSAGTSDGAIQPDSDRALTFGGAPAVTIPPGAMVMSDPVRMRVAAFQDLAVSVFLPHQQVSSSTCHPKAWSTNFLNDGDTVAAVSVPAARRVESWCYIKGVDVRATRASRAVVTLGDSITDGGHATLDANHRWPDFLAKRLLANRATAAVSVLNAGIGGNRILGGGPDNPNALARFDRDVLSQSGVRYLIVLEGVNDLGRLHRLTVEQGAASPGDLIFGLSQLAERAHTHGIKVFAGTIMPYGGATHFSSAGEKEREEVNRWIRRAGAFDGVIDFDKAVRDPVHPRRLLPAYDHGDHLHLSDAGYQAMAASVDLAWFQ